MCFLGVLSEPCGESLKFLFIIRPDVVSAGGAAGT
jgi:hypothetical protein